MTAVQIDGIDGSELFGFLSGLGVLRILSVTCEQTTLAWTLDGEAWKAVVAAGSGELTLDRVAGILEEGLVELSRDRSDSITLGWQFIDFTRQEFRSAQQLTVDRWRKAVLAPADEVLRYLTKMIAPAAVSAMGSEAIVVGKKNEKIRRTPLSLSNGQGNQNLLKDFRTLAGLSNRQAIDSSLRGAPQQHPDHSLNWHPGDYRPAAYRWSNSFKDKPTCDPVMNALAYVGLSYFPVIPDPGMAVPGISMRSDQWEFTWPLWDPPLESDRVAALLQQGRWYLDTPDTGVTQIRQTSSITIGRQNELTYVTPSRRIR